MNKEFIQIGISDAMASYFKARNIVKEKTNGKVPFRSLEVARKFDELYPDKTGYILDLTQYRKIIPNLPSKLVVITSSEASAELITTQDFESLSIDVPSHNALRPFHSKFIFFRDTKDEWAKDKRIAGRVFNHERISQVPLLDNASSALTDLQGLKKKDKLPPYWTKYLVLHQMINYLTEQNLSNEVLEDALKAQGYYTKSSLIAIFLGTRPELANLVLTQYNEMINRISYNFEQNPRGILAEIMPFMENAKSKEVLFTLIAGLNLLRSYIDFSLFTLSFDKRFQEQARTDKDYLKRFTQETALHYPIMPYVMRKVTKDFEFQGKTIPSSSLIIFATFAFSNKENQITEFNPERENLNSMTTGRGGIANPFFYGPRSCLGRHLAPAILQATLSAILDKYDVECNTQGKPILGEISLRFSKPLEFILTDRETKKQIKATSSF
ncbi:MAG: cytochrome P450 [Nanoarchaeota archaeon]